MRISLPRRGGASGERARSLLDVAPVAIVELDSTGVVREWNHAAEALVGWAAAEVLGRPLPESILGREPRIPELIARILGGDDRPVLKLRCRHRQGRLIEVEAHSALTRDGDGRPRGAVMVLTDMTEQRRTERKLRYQALHDALTHLPNRVALLNRLAETLDAAPLRGRRTGLLMIDLDRFKEVNDTLGHACGDQLLAQIGPRLLSVAVRDNDMIARLSGDEFAILLPGLDRVEDATAIAERVLAALHTPFPLEDTIVDIGASIGIAVGPEHGDDPDTLMRNADTAMYEAKETSSGVTLYHPRTEERAQARFGMLGQLRRALDRRELVVHYQPKVDITTEQACGTEALVRWQHPSRGLLPPVEFIPVAETSGLIGRLTNYVLDAALGQARAWLDAGARLPVSVNLSARSLDDLTLPQQVRAMLARHGVPPELLCLEITETAVMHDPDSALVVLGELSTAGVELSLDDFGTGYSSMSYLQRLPVTELKIDRSFITGLHGSSANDVLVRSTIELGHGLNLRVVAEGVEDAETVAALRELGCDVVQGYYYARPMPPEEFDLWQRARRLASSRQVG